MALLVETKADNPFLFESKADDLSRSPVKIAEVQEVGGGWSRQGDDKESTKACAITNQGSQEPIKDQPDGANKGTTRSCHGCEKEPSKDHRTRPRTTWSRHGTDKGANHSVYILNIFHCLSDLAFQNGFSAGA